MSSKPMLLTFFTVLRALSQSASSPRRKTSRHGLRSMRSESEPERKRTASGVSEISAGAPPSGSSNRGPGSRRPLWWTALTRIAPSHGAVISRKRAASWSVSPLFPMGCVAATSRTRSGRISVSKTDRGEKVATPLRWSQPPLVNFMGGDSVGVDVTPRGRRGGARERGCGACRRRRGRNGCRRSAWRGSSRRTTGFRAP